MSIPSCNVSLSASTSAIPYIYVSTALKYQGPNAQHSIAEKEELHALYIEGPHKLGRNSFNYMGDPSSRLTPFFLMRACSKHISYGVVDGASIPSDGFAQMLDTEPVRQTIITEI